MRLFTGIGLSADVARQLSALIADLRAHAGIRWSRVENLHITTKFIGEWPAERAGEVKIALARLDPRPEIPITLKGLGWFPNPHQPRLLFAAVEAPVALSQLARDTESALETLGIARETRPFSPHLTLARITNRGGPPPDLTRLRRAIAAWPSDGFGTFRAREFHLYLSEPTPAGSAYTSLAAFPLERP